MANWKETIDNKLQWHDFINPVGMAAFTLNNVKDAFNNITGANAAAAIERAEQREDTQYQRGVADMKAAGLNPALLVNGMSSPAPSYSSAQSVSNTAAQTQSQTNLITSALMLILALKGGGGAYRGTNMGFM